MKTFAIIGAAGYIGNHLRNYLAIKYPDCYIYEIDIDPNDQFRYRSLESVDKLNTDFDAVFHLAATSDVGSGYGSPYSLLDNNLTVTMEAIRAFKGRARSFVFASSSAVYQEIDGPLNETSALRELKLNIGNDTYGDSKILCEKILKTANHEYGLKYTSLRIGNVAGYDCNVTKKAAFEKHLIPKLLRWRMKDPRFPTENSFKFFGDPDKFVRDYVHVGDVCRAFDLAHLALLNARDIPRAINIGTGIGTTNSDILQKANGRRYVELTQYDRLARQVYNDIVDERPAEPKKIILNPALAEKTIGWKPEKNIDDIFKSIPM